MIMKTTRVKERWGNTTTLLLIDNNAHPRLNSILNPKHKLIKRYLTIITILSYTHPHPSINKLTN